MIPAMLSEAWRAMMANRLRTFLTMLGMIIGVGAVVLMLALGEGARATIKKQVDSQGSHLFMILAGAQISGGVRTASGQHTSLTKEDADALRELPGVAAASPVVSGYMQLVADGLNWNTQVIGSNFEFLRARAWEIKDGRPLDEVDDQAAARVAVIGVSTAKELFGRGDPLGRTIRIKGMPFEVVGLLAPKGQSLTGQDQDDAVIVPLSAFQRFLSGSRFRGSVRMIIVQAESSRIMASLEEDLRARLRERHRLTSPGQDDDFFINNLAAVLAAAEATARAMALLLGAIASISLAVGGIGIMNIMLVSVTERTREIGLRLAVGARSEDILAQFIMEALLVSVTGGLIGLLLGTAGAFLVRAVFDFNTAITAFSLGLSFTVSAAVGLFFGFYPAYKAAGQNPIEALRYQ